MSIDTPYNTCIYFQHLLVSEYQYITASMCNVGRISIKFLACLVGNISRQYCTLVLDILVLSIHV